MITLSKEERDRFAAYLKQEAATEDGLIKQMIEIGTSDIVVKHRKQKVAAMVIVALDLESWEEQNLG